MSTTKTGQKLQAPPFSATPTLIPSFNEGKFTGHAYKAELVLLRSPEGGARQHVWFEPDPRIHNHPWEYIDCKVVWGYYRAVEYRPLASGGFEEFLVILRSGDAEHRVPHDTDHQVCEVLPGTVSIMTFGAAVGDGKQWGHLVGSSEAGWRHEPSTTQEGFVDALRHLNPHMRPADWVNPYEALPRFTPHELIAQLGC